MSRGTTGSSKCGWCITETHDQCKPQIQYFDKLWNCSCEKCHPDVVTLETTNQDGETNENQELVQEPIQD